MKYEKLFSPMNIGKMQVKNRIVMAPMLMGLGDFDGKPTQMLVDYYEERAKGGAGLIVTEVTRVNDWHGATAFAQLAMSHDHHIEPMRKFAERIHSHGAKLAVQLHHPGRQNLGLLIGTVPLLKPFAKYKPVKKMIYKMTPLFKKLMERDLVPKVYAPSVVERSKFAESKMRALTNKQIKSLINDFVLAAERCYKAGVDAVMLHAAHGYLIQQFLSPFTNRRQDEYGGSPENRMRFLLEIIAGIRRRCGDYPIIVRLTADECYGYIGEQGKGYDLKEGIEMAKILENAGVDALDISSAAYDTFNYWLEPTSFTPGWRAYMAQEVKKAVSIPVIAANLIRSPEQAERQLQEGVQDFISLGRPHLADPHWANKVKEGRAEDIKRCICCLYCIQSMQENAFVGTHGLCAVNPWIGREGELNDLPADGQGKVVAVVGAGVAGLTAAEILGRRGFKPVVFEKSGKAGGQILLAVSTPKKDKLMWSVNDLVTAAQKAGAQIRYNTAATPETLKELNPYAVIIATGGVALRPRSIEGVDLPSVYTVTDILDGSVKLKDKKVAVIGSGMTGLETSVLLKEQGNKVTIIEMAEEVAPGTWFQHTDDVLPKLKDAEIVTGHKLIKITDTGIVVENTQTGEQKQIPEDNVVLSLGVRPEKSLYDAVSGVFDKVYLIGDAAKVGRIANATQDALQAALSIK
jgi:2,4-dienoyl-CoA reductase-like NADH-dependent reductase (Old Yellow Enzyme family)/thioredoxin reductase